MRKLWALHLFVRFDRLSQSAVDKAGHREFNAWRSHVDPIRPHCRRYVIFSINCMAESS